MRRLLLSTVCCCVFAALSAQVGGLHTYEFLTLSPSARVSALGGVQIAVVDDDVSLAAQNPAVLNADMQGRLSFNHAFYLAGIQYGYAAAGWYRSRWRTAFHAGAQYVSYGSMPLTNEMGEQEGDFSAGEYALTIGAARPIDERLRLGANLRLVTSRFESYNSLGLAADLAALYQDTARRFNATIVFRNIGYQLSTYREGNQEPLPFEMQVGVSKRLRYLPFRFSIIYRYLNRWNILYDDPDNSESPVFLGEEPTERSPFAVWTDNFFRHFVFNGELLIGRRENFRLRLGYSHLLRQELSVADYRSLGGITFGAGIKINRFRLDYGRTNFHLGGGLNHLGISTNLSEFK